MLILGFLAGDLDSLSCNKTNRLNAPDISVFYSINDRRDQQSYRENSALKAKVRSAGCRVWKKYVKQ